jgi:hypothetical protein
MPSATMQAEATQGAATHSLPMPGTAAPRAAAPRTMGAGEAWERFLSELERTSPSLGAILRQRGRLAELGVERALIQLAHLRPAERALVDDARNQRQCRQALESVLGRAIEVALEDQAASRAAPDAYTARVAGLFDGGIEDRG